MTTNSSSRVDVSPSSLPSISPSSEVVSGSANLKPTYASVVPCSPTRLVPLSPLQPIRNFLRVDTVQSDLPSHSSSLDSRGKGKWRRDIPRKDKRKWVKAGSRAASSAHAINASSTDAFARIAGAYDALREIKEEKKQDRKDTEAKKVEEKKPFPIPLYDANLDLQMFIHVKPTYGRWAKWAMWGLKGAALALMLPLACRVRSVRSAFLFSIPLAVTVAIDIPALLANMADGIRPYLFESYAATKNKFSSDPDQLVRFRRKSPSIEQKLSMVQTLLRGFDSGVQKLACATGVRDHIVTGKVIHLGSTVIKADHDVRPTNVRANPSVEEQVVLHTSVVLPLHQNSASLCVYSPEIVGQVRSQVATSPLDVRAVQALDLSSRTSNLNFPSRMWADVQYDSGLMASIMVTVQDLSRDRICHMLHLNQSGVTSNVYMDMATALATALPLIFALTMALKSSFFRRFTWRLLGGPSRSLLGQLYPG